jgi:hypothetical protein
MISSNPAARERFTTLIDRKGQHDPTIKIRRIPALFTQAQSADGSPKEPWNFRHTSGCRKARARSPIFQTACLIMVAQARKTKNRQHSTRRHWSGAVTRKSNALDLEPKIFASRNPRRIALSLKRSAEKSRRRKGTPYQSAMSMLNFYINRAGGSLARSQKHALQRAKPELRKFFGRENVKQSRRAARPR